MGSLLAPQLVQWTMTKTLDCYTFKCLHQQKKKSLFKSFQLISVGCFGGYFVALNLFDAYLEIDCPIKKSFFKYF